MMNIKRHKSTCIALCFIFFLSFFIYLFFLCVCVCLGADFPGTEFLRRQYTECHFGKGADLSCSPIVYRNVKAP